MREEREHIIPIRKEEQETTTESLQQKQHLQSFTSSNEQQHTDTPKAWVSSSSVQQPQECHSAQSTTESSVQQQQQQQQASALTTNSEVSDNLHLRQDSTVSEDNHNKLCIPISMKGSFFNDSFFDDTRKHFTNAVRKVLKNTEQSSCHYDELTSYRSLLKRNPKLENQAVHMEEDEHSMKVNSVLLS